MGEVQVKNGAEGSSRREAASANVADTAMLGVGPTEAVAHRKARAPSLDTGYRRSEEMPIPDKDIDKAKPSREKNARQLPRRIWTIVALAAMAWMLIALISFGIFG
jgi:hypothetical protein